MTDAAKAQRHHQRVEALELADRLVRIASDPEVQRWFASHERGCFEAALAAETEMARIAALADVRAIRALKGHLAGVKEAARRAAQDINLTETTNAR